MLCWAGLGWAGVELMRSLCGDSEEPGLGWAGLAGLGWAGAREHDTPAASTEQYLAGERLTRLKMYCAVYDEAFVLIYKSII